MEKRRGLIAFLKQPTFWFYVLLVGVGKVLADLTGQTHGVELTDYLRKPLRHLWGQILAVLATIGIAKFLSWVRRRHLKSYATVEFFVATVAVWAAFRPNGTDGITLEQVLKLLAGGYLMIRSFDTWNTTSATDQVAVVGTPPGRP